MFTLMLMLEIVELLLAIVDDTDKDKFIADQDGNGRIWDCAYSIFRLENVLGYVMKQSNIVLRLGAILESPTEALEVQEFVTEATKYVYVMRQVPD